MKKIKAKQATKPTETHKLEDAGMTIIENETIKASLVSPKCAMSWVSIIPIWVF